MPLDTLLALTAFAFVSTWTPGPNNMMLAASGATWGWRQTLPHALGVALGFPIMAFCVALGLGQVFIAFPIFGQALAWIGCTIMLWLAWRIATAAPPAADDAPQGRGRPLSFVEASAFQWINPKAWVMTIGVSASFVRGETPLIDALAIMVAFVCAGLTSSQAWVLFGTAAARLLGRGAGLRAFNIAMALLLAISALWLVIDN
ncbi:MAG: LysE family translocator [Pseudomonadota bacterium]